MTGVLQWPKKDPSEVLDYTINWGGLGAITGGDTIKPAEEDGVVWTLPPDVSPPVGIQIAPAGMAQTTTTTTIWLQGGEDGKAYRIVCNITTAQGRVFERDVLLRISEQW